MAEYYAKITLKKDNCADCPFAIGTVDWGKMVAFCTLSNKTLSMISMYYIKGSEDIEIPRPDFCPLILVAEEKGG